MQIQIFSLAPCCQIYRVTEEAQVAETAVWPIIFLMNMLTALKGSQCFYSQNQYVARQLEVSGKPVLCLHVTEIQVSRYVNLVLNTSQVRMLVAIAIFRLKRLTMENTI